MHIIAFVIDLPTVITILTHLGAYLPPGVAPRRVARRCVQHRARVP